MERPTFDLTLARESLPALLEGLKITVELTFIVLAISLVLGVIVALCRLSKNRVLSAVTGFYVDFMRSTPLLVQLIYIYFVLPTIGIRLDPFVAGVVGLSLNYSAYLSEVYRSGIQAIPRGQLDAAAALGMRPSLTMRRIVLPQAIRIVIPPLGNYFVSLFKDTSLVSVLTLQELLFSGQIIISRTYDYFTIYTMVLLLYFLVCYPSLMLVRHLEKLTKAGYRRRQSPGGLLLPVEPT
ncbi:MAG: ectoine/hydroxyectoine ABC transporter permease subunit EhuD [Thermomicrobiales bacterium]|nr:ectoine/hydroxyectoine ABC transporter permease subunit EhuD [Thermomicrobiales bacterium]